MAGEAGAAPEPAEAVARRVWRSAGIPGPGGSLGPAHGPWVRQQLGMIAPGDPVPQVVARAVRADIDARFLMLSGCRVSGTLREAGGELGDTASVLADLLPALGVWTGGTGQLPWDSTERGQRVQGLVERLAEKGILALKPGAVRLCPHCGVLRSPERTYYQVQVGDTYLVRFPLGGAEPTGDAVAWVDAPWRLLGTTALLVSPDLKYVVVEYQREGVRARLVVARSALERLGAWLPGATFTVLREVSGRELVGVPYAHPLRHEFPALAQLVAPAGTVQAALDVGDSGTGIVPLVPSHGGSDPGIAERLGVPALPLLTPHGTVDPGFAVKYRGVDLDTANEFALRDLTEGANVLARLRVLRGVPRCASCGTGLLWVPGKAWRLELAQLPDEIAERYAALLPGEPSLAQLDLTPWPVSESDVVVTEGGVCLSECNRCDRLARPGTPPGCPCGGERADVRRRLLPAFEGAVGAWAGRGSEDAETEVRLYLNDRRRVPSVVHHLVVLASLEAEVGDLLLRLVPSAPEGDLTLALREHGPDAVRAALLVAEQGRGTTASFVERVRQERRRLDRLVALSRSAAAAGGRASGPSRAGGPLEPIDRAVLARFQQVRQPVVADLENGDAEAAYRRLVRFVEGDLELYREILARSAPDARNDTAAATGALPELLEGVATVLAPIAPFTAEAIHAAVLPGGGPLFGRAPFTVEPPVITPSMLERWQEWRSVLHAVSRFRREHGLAPNERIARAAILVEQEAVASRLRSDLPRLQPALGVERLEIGSPEHPWAGRLQRIVPVEEEVAKAYPAIAPQVVHLLRRLPPRGPGGADPLRDVSVVVGGLPRPVPAHMLKVAEELPTGFVRSKFELGELFAPAKPAGSSPAERSLSVDAQWIERRLFRRLRAVPGSDGATRPAVTIVAPAAVAAELAPRSLDLARSCGASRVDITSDDVVVPTLNRLHGRTHAGERWTIFVASAPPPARRRKERRPAGRVAPTSPRAETPRAEPVDYLGPTVLAREEGLRALAEELSGILGVPAIGPAKAAFVWDAGYHAAGDVLAAPYGALAVLPGFGRPVASALLEHAGRPVPDVAEAAASGMRWPVPAEPAPPIPAASPSRPAVPDSARAAADPSGSGPRLSRGPPPPPKSSVGHSVPAPGPAAAPPGASAPSPVGTPVRPVPTVAPTEIAPAAAAHAPVPPRREGGVGVEIGSYASFTAAALPFLEATSAGHHGLALVADGYDRMRLLVGSRKVAVVRFQPPGTSGGIDPGDLEAVSGTIARAASDEQVRAFFLEGFERLVERHGYEPAARWLATTDDVLRRANARMWVHLNEPLLGRERATLLRRAFAPEPAGPGDAVGDAAVYHG